MPSPHPACLSGLTWRPVQAEERSASKHCPGEGGKAGAAPAKRGPVEDSSSTQQKWPRIECVQAQASAQPAAVVDGKARQQQPQAAQHRGCL